MKTTEPTHSVITTSTHIHTYSKNFGTKVLYFLEYFPWVLLISVYAQMWVQFKGGNKAKAGLNTILYMHIAFPLHMNMQSVSNWNQST